MADQVAVQDEVSKRIAGLVWCLIGSEEEDEFAGSMYLRMIEEEEDVEQVGMMEVKERDEDEDQREDEEEEVKAEDDVKEGEHDDQEHGEQCHGESTAEHGHSATPEENDENVKHSKGAHLVSLFYRTFFQTLKREWYNLDKYRIDKFYTLIRFMMREMYKYISFRHWNYGILRLLNDVLYEEVLTSVPNGIRLHVCDLVLEELLRVDTDSGLKLTEATFVEVLEPFLVLCASEKDLTVRHRATEQILETFLTRYSLLNDAQLQKLKTKSKLSPQNTSQNHIFEQVHVGSFAETIFGLASDERTLDKYRKSLYDIHKKYIRRIKDVGFDVDISMQHEDHHELLLQPGEKDAHSHSNLEENYVQTKPQKSKQTNDTIKSAHDEQKHDKKHKKKKKDKHNKQAQSEANSTTPIKPSKINYHHNPTPENHDQPSQEEQQTKGKKKKRKQKRNQEKQINDDNKLKQKTNPIDVLEPTTKEANKEDDKEHPKKTKHYENDNDTSKPTPVEELLPSKTVQNDGTATEKPGNQDTSTPKKSKKKKKKKKAFDKVISISHKEQQQEAEKAAASSSTHTPPKKEETSPPSSEDDDKKPRVKFGKFNHAKSYSASMRALRTLDPSTTLSKTPDKSIIRPPKHSSTSKVVHNKSSGQKRKKRMST